MLAILILVDCSTSAIDAADLSLHVQRELATSERFTAACEETALRVRSESGVDLSIPLADVAYSARARTVALALSEHLRVPEEVSQPPKVEATEAIEPPPERSPWRIAGSLEGGTTLKADGLLAGAGFEVTRMFGWFGLHGDALILGGSSDQKPLLAFIFRAGAAGELALAQALDLDLGIRIEGGPIFGFEGGGRLRGIFGGGPEIGLRWAFAPPVQLQIEVAGIYTTAKVPLIFLAVGVAYDL